MTFKDWLFAVRHRTESLADLRQLAEAIHSSKQLLQSVIDSTPDWIQVKDTKHRFILVNRSFAKAMGQTPEDMIGRVDADVMALHLGGDVDAQIAAVRARDAAALAGESIRDASEEIVLKNGEVRTFDMFKGPLRDASGNIYAVLTFRRDVTERRRSEQEQLALAEQLRQAQKMEVIGHLTGGIAHDFNNILTAIFGFAELALLSPAVKQDATVSRYLQRIVEAGARARDLVSQLLTFSHKRGPANESSGIVPIVKEVTKLLRSTLPATLSIDTQVSPDLPDALISSIQLHQVLMNLGVNAADAIGTKGSIEIRAACTDVAAGAICASCHRSFGGGYLSIGVKDTGSGIPEENLPKIFDPFFTTKEVGKGTGLGLSVLHGIVHSANGHVQVRSRPGAGTEFEVFLPVSPDPGRQPAPEAATTEAGFARVRGRVMLVDDERDILEFMSALLESIGCSVRVATGPVQAWKMFAENPRGVDLVITDQTMADMTGAELARAMLAHRPDLPVLLSTGYSAAIDDDAVRAIGIRRLLRKPVPSRVLCELVAQYLPRADG
jgi:PAS domain S-box-containing protein